MAIVKLVETPQFDQDPGDEIHSLADLRAFIARMRLDQFPLDVMRVAKALGMKVQLEQMDDDMSGYLEKCGGQWVIGVNNFHHPVRQRFTIAHELAHYALHRGQLGEGRIEDYTFARRSTTTSQMERQADEFAADLLMPAAAVSTAVQEGNRNINMLAAQFAVSTIAMKYRLENLHYRLG